MNWTYEDTTDSFSVSIGEFIAPRSILLADITQATLMIKVSKSDLDENALTVLDLDSGLTLVAGTTEAEALLVVKFKEGDFGSDRMASGGIYHMGLGIKVAGQNNYQEVRLVDSRIKVVLDSIHDEGSFSSSTGVPTLDLKIYQGDDKTFKFNFSTGGDPVDLSLYDIELECAEVSLAKSAVIAPDQVNDKGDYEFVYVPADTQSLTVPFRFLYEVVFYPEGLGGPKNTKYRGFIIVTEEVVP